jgi:arylsulfatase
MSWPEHIQKGIQSDALVELIDVTPTLLEAAGIEVPYFVQGRSLMPLLRGGADPHVHKSGAASEFHDSCQFNEGTDGPTQSVMSCDGLYKMVTYRGHDLGELFDLDVDPGEFTDLWDDPAHQSLKLEVMQRHVDAIMGSIGAGPRRSIRY